MTSWSSVGGLGRSRGLCWRSCAALGAYVGGPGPSWAEKWPWPEREGDLASGSRRKVAARTAHAPEASEAPEARYAFFSIDIMCLFYIVSLLKIMLWLFDVHNMFYHTTMFYCACLSGT